VCSAQDCCTRVTDKHDQIIHSWAVILKVIMSDIRRKTVPDGRNQDFKYHATIKTRRLSVTEVGVAGSACSAHALYRKADVNWKL